MKRLSLTGAFEVLIDDFWSFCFAYWISVADFLKLIMHNFEYNLKSYLDTV